MPIEIQTSHGPITLGQRDKDYIYGAGGVGRGLDIFIQAGLLEGGVDILPILSVSTNVLCIGVGRGRILFDLLKQFPQLDISSVSREDLLYTNIDSLMDHAVANSKYRGEVNLMEAQEILTRIQKSQILADASEGLPYPDQSFDTLLCGLAVTDYIQGKSRFLSEVKRVLRQDGTAVIDLNEFAVIHKGNINNVDFFEMMGEEYKYGKRYDRGGILTIHNTNPSKRVLPLKFSHTHLDDSLGPNAVIYTEYYNSLI